MKIVLNIFNKSRQIKDLKKELATSKAISKIEVKTAKNQKEYYEQRIKKQDELEKRYEALKYRQQTTIDELVERLKNSAEDRKNLQEIVAKQKNRLNKFYANNGRHTHKKSPRNISKSQGLK